MCYKISKSVTKFISIPKKEGTTTVVIAIIIATTNRDKEQKCYKIAKSVIKKQHKQHSQHKKNYLDISK